MIYIYLNLLPIMAATLLGLAIGAVYHRIGGGTARMPSPGLIVTAALGEFWLAAILAGALILAPPKADPWIMAVGSAVVIWAGFVLPLLAITLGYRGVPVRLIVRDCAQWLILMVAQAVLMKAMGLVPPPV